MYIIPAPAGAVRWTLLCCACAVADMLRSVCLTYRTICCAESCLDPGFELDKEDIQYVSVDKVVCNGASYLVDGADVSSPPTLNPLAVLIRSLTGY